MFEQPKQEKMEGHVIWLITQEQFDKLPDGTALVAIDGEEVVKGSDKIDMDTRFGHLAFGVKDQSILTSNGMEVDPRARYETNS